MVVSFLSFKEMKTSFKGNPSLWFVMAVHGLIDSHYTREPILLLNPYPHTIMCEVILKNDG